MAGCGRRCVKLLMMAGNMLFLLSGLALAGLGGWIRYKSKDYDTIMGATGLETPANFLISTGAIVFLVAFFGFCGAYKENKCLLQLYVLFVGLIIFVEVAAVVFAFAIRHRAEDYINTSLASAIAKTYNKKGHEPITKAIDEIQKTLKCCGATGPNDYGTLNSNTTIPKSCNDKENKTTGAVIPFQKGCVDAMKDFVSSNLLLCGGLAAGILLIELIGILGSIILVRKRKFSQRVKEIIVNKGASSLELERGTNKE
eukprot:Seg605.1 transcript_id=Seg605.1/GoldUCD/mRNA.D3Y31 product="CD63 antigen" protein_id=Seg605.1/GoldUCD/D3Y31